MPEPLADQHVRYAYAQSLRQKVTKDITAKAWKAANDALTRAAALLLGTTADFSRDMLTQQCECAFRLQNVKVAARTCDNALKKQPKSRIAAEALKWAKEEKRKQSTTQCCHACKTITTDPPFPLTYYFRGCDQTLLRSNKSSSKNKGSSSSDNSSSSDSSSSSNANASSRIVVFNSLRRCEENHFYCIVLVVVTLY